MIIACNIVYESCRDTDVFLIDTNQVKDSALAARLVAAKADDWFEVDDDEYDDVSSTKVKLPAVVEKLLTLYMP